MKTFKYAESIFCESCRGRVKMVDCRVAAKKVKTKPQVEIDYACVDCGQRGSASRDAEFLHFSEREFCISKGLSVLKPKAKGQGVVFTVSR
jgi:hypothetical protein